MDWKQEDDLLLTETVLRYIREGNTQIAAFDEVAKKLNRTASSCGFRWNSVVRLNYKNAIALAKKQREQNFYHKIEGRKETIRRLTEEAMNRNDGALRKMDENVSLNYKTYLEVKHAYLDEGVTVNFVAEKLRIPVMLARCLTKDWGEQSEKVERIENETDKIILEKTDIINKLEEENEKLQQELMVCKEDVGMLIREKKEKESQ